MNRKVLLDVHTHTIASGHEGGLDLNDEYLDRLDIAIAGIHSNCWHGSTKEDLVIKFMKRVWVFIVVTLSLIHI